MAKDGTSRGGSRIGSGKKPTKSKKVQALNNSILETVELDAPSEIEGVDIPPIKEYLKAKQKNGKETYAEEIYKATYLWLKKRGCDKLVSQQLVESYALSCARYIQCEEAISEFGFLAKHPTTGNAIASPYVQMSQSYMKQVNNTWYQIYSIVKDNGSADVEELDSQDIMMERLLSAKKGH